MKHICPHCGRADAGFVAFEYQAQDAERPVRVMNLESAAIIQPDLRLWQVRVQCRLCCETYLAPLDIGEWES